MYTNVLYICLQTVIFYQKLKEILNYTMKATNVNVVSLGINNFLFTKELGISVINVTGINTEICKTTNILNLKVSSSKSSRINMEISYFIVTHVSSKLKEKISAITTKIYMKLVVIPLKSVGTWQVGTMVLKYDCMFLTNVNI